MAIKYWFSIYETGDGWWCSDHTMEYKRATRRCWNTSIVWTVLWTLVHLKSCVAWHCGFNKIDFFSERSTTTNRLCLLCLIWFASTFLLTFYLSIHFVTIHSKMMCKNASSIGMWIDFMSAMHLTPHSNIKRVNTIDFLKTHILRIIIVEVAADFNRNTKNGQDALFKYAKQNSVQI